MIENIVLTKDEFKELDLKMVGSYGKDIIYKGLDNTKSYLLSLDYCEGKGSYYKGIILTRLDETRREMTIKFLSSQDDSYTCQEYDNHKRFKG